MAKQHKYRVYRTLLYLYPRAHRQEYGEQMVQTLDDLLADHDDAYGRFTIWLRVASELPLNAFEENIHNMGEFSMGKLSKVSNKQLVIGATAILLFVAGWVAIFLMHRGEDYVPTQRANVKHASTLPACLQKTTNTALKVPKDDSTFIENSLASSIIDIPAGTEVLAYFKTYSGRTATGSSVYSGKFGNYNFTAQKIADNNTNSYVGGWKITKLEVCK